MNRKPARRLVRWPYGSQGLVLLWAIGLVILLESCIGQAKTSTRIVCGSCEEPERFVRLETAPTEPTRQYSHPFSLSPEDWKPILTSIRIQAGPRPFFFDRRPEMPAFTPEDVEYLSGTLSKAFAQAQPREWVVFGLSQPGAPGVAEMTTGGWYRDGMNLHFVLANYRWAVTMPSLKEFIGSHPLVPSTPGEFTLLPGAHQTVLDRSPTYSVLGISPSEVSIAYQPLLLGEAPARPASQTASTPPQADRKDQPPAQLSLEGRLQTLKRLRDQGLITDEDYAAKKSQLLSQF